MGRTRLQALPFPECLHQAIAYIPKANTRRQLRTDFGLIQSRTGVRYDDPHVFTGGLRDDGNFGAFFFRRHRSEEHTSELQSLMRISYAVFCLKKKNIQLTKY